MASKDRSNGDHSYLSHSHSLSSALLDTDDLISGIDDSLGLSQGDRNKSSKGGRISRQEYEQKQSLHNIQLLRIELSQKSLIIDNLKAEHMNKVEELEERLNDALHMKHLLQARLDSFLSVKQDENHRRKLKTQQEIKIILDRQRELEQTNKKLEAKGAFIFEQLERDAHITEEQYIEIKSKSKDDLSLHDYFAFRLYEESRPFRFETSNMKSQRDKLSIEISNVSNQLYATQQQHTECQRNLSESNIRLSSMSDECKYAKQTLESFRSKAEQLNEVKSQRDDFEKKLFELQKNFSFLTAENANVVKQLADVNKDKGDLTCSAKYLNQDKEYMTKQLTDISSKYEMQCDTLQRTQRELDNVKKAREELYERYVTHTSDSRAEFERKLQDEMDRLRLQTDGEIRKLQMDSKSVYEQEVKSLREARDIALQERDQAMKNRDDSDKRNVSLAMELQTLQTTIDSRVSAANNDATMKIFQLEKLKISYDETKSNLLKYEEESEKLTKKLSAVTNEFHQLQKTAELSENDLTNKVQLLENRLATYEKLETELDDAVIQVAQLHEDDAEAEKVLFSYGHGGNIPSNAKMRMRQSVHLARRILQLENLNMSLNSEVQTSKKVINKLKEELSDCEKFLKASSQPHQYLIESLREKSQNADQWKEKFAQTQNKLDQSKQENKKLLSIKKELSLDLDRLLSHKQELQVIKQVIRNLPTTDSMTTIPHKPLEGAIDPIVFSKR